MPATERYAMGYTKPSRHSHQYSARAEAQPKARCSGCTNNHIRLIVKTGCPVHDPMVYTAFLARHCTDTI